MKFSIDKKELTKALRLAAGIAPTKKSGAIPVHKYVRMYSSGGAVTLLATNGEASLKLELEANVSEEFDACFPLKQLQGLVKLPANEIVISDSGNRVVVKSGNSKMTIPIIDSGHFPTPGLEPGGLEGCRVRVSIDSLLALVELALIAAGKLDISRWTFSGLQTVVNSESIVVYSCDGSQIAKAKLSGLSNDTEGTSAIIPTDAFNGLRELMNYTKSGDVDLIIGENSVMMQTDAGTGLFRRVAGKYPDIEKPLAIEQSYSIEIDSQLFSQCLERAVFFAPKSGYCKITFETGKVTVLAEDADIGKFEETIDAEFSIDYPVTLAVNAKSVFSCLRKLSGLIRFEFSYDTHVPFFIRSVSDSTSFDYVGARFAVA